MIPGTIVQDRRSIDDASPRFAGEIRLAIHSLSQGSCVTAMPGLQTVAAMVGVLGVIGVGGVSRARHNFSEKTEAALNAQINLEYEASHAYAAMSA